MDELCPKDHMFDGLFAPHTQESLGVSPAESLWNEHNIHQPNCS